MPLLGDVFLDTVYAENPDGSVKTSDHPIESGVDITDHIERQPNTMSISGIVTGPDAAKRLSQLKVYRDTGEILTYSYRNILSNVIIEDFKTTHDKDVKGGFKFDISLKQIRISQPAIIKSLALPQRVQVKKVTSKGRQQKQPIAKVREQKITKPKQPPTRKQLQSTFVGDNRHTTFV